MGNTSTYREIDFWGNLEQAVEKLQACHQRGRKVFIDFNGHKLYSDTVTMDSAYLEVLGETKAEFEKEQEEWRGNYRKAEEEHKAQIPALSQEWMEKGHCVLDKKYWAEWDKIVPIRLGDLYHGMELDACLNIIKPLNEGCTLEEAKGIIESQNHSGMSFSLACALVEAFCDRGKEFVAFVR